MAASSRNLSAVPDLGEEANAPPPGERIAPAGPADASFLGLAAGGPLDRAVVCASYADFADAFSDPDRPRGGAHLEGTSLAHAVRGFFSNGGRQCVVARAAGEPDDVTLAGQLEALALLGPLTGGAGLAAPDAHLLGGDAPALQQAMIDQAARTTGAMAVLDPPDGLSADEVVRWRHAELGDPAAAALFWPWVSVPNPRTGGPVTAPASGCALGVWARTDARHGPDRAATGQAVLAVEALEAEIDAASQRSLNRAGVNVLRPWPGPEPRLWGGRSLSSDPSFCHVHHRRLVAHIAASVAAGTRWALDQADDDQVRERVLAAVVAFLGTWWRRAALQGATPEQAFSAACEAGPDGLVIDLGLALRRPSDLHAVRISIAG